MRRWPHTMSYDAPRYELRHSHGRTVLEARVLSGKLSSFCLHTGLATQTDRRAPTSGSPVLLLWDPRGVNLFRTLFTQKLYTRSSLAIWAHRSMIAFRPNGAPSGSSCGGVSGLICQCSISALTLILRHPTDRTNSAEYVCVRRCNYLPWWDRVATIVTIGAHPPWSLSRKQLALHVPVPVQNAVSCRHSCPGHTGLKMGIKPVLKRMNRHCTRSISRSTEFYKGYYDS